MIRKIHEDENNTSQQIIMGLKFSTFLLKITGETLQLWDRYMNNVKNQLELSTELPSNFLIFFFFIRFTILFFLSNNQLRTQYTF